MWDCELHSVIAGYIGSKCYCTNDREQNPWKAIKYKNTEKDSILKVT